MVRYRILLISLVSILLGTAQSQAQSCGPQGYPCYPQCWPPCYPNGKCVPPYPPFTGMIPLKTNKSSFNGGPIAPVQGNGPAAPIPPQFGNYGGPMMGQMGGKPTFPVHPCVRSPRDFFMICD